MFVIAPRDESACMKYVTTCSTCPCCDILRPGLRVGGWGGWAGGGVALTGKEASDVGNFRVCVMFAQTDERRRFDVSDEDNNLSGPCVECQAAGQKKKKRWGVGGIWLA